MAMSMSMWPEKGSSTVLASGQFVLASRCVRACARSAMVTSLLCCMCSRSAMLSAVMSICFAGHQYPQFINVCSAIVSVCFAACEHDQCYVFSAVVSVCFAACEHDQCHVFSAVVSVCFAACEHDQCYVFSAVRANSPLAARHLPLATACPCLLRSGHTRERALLADVAHSASATTTRRRQESLLPRLLQAPPPSHLSTTEQCMGRTRVEKLSG
jgi:hypothetical protein